jgi:hypothetical protein
MTILHLNLLLSNGNRGLALFSTSESKVIGAIKTFCLITLKRPQYAAEKSGDRAQPIQTIADPLNGFVPIEIDKADIVSPGSQTKLAQLSSIEHQRLTVSLNCRSLVKAFDTWMLREFGHG